MIILSAQFSKPNEDILLKIKDFKIYELLGCMFICIFFGGVLYLFRNKKKKLSNYFVGVFSEITN